MEFQSFSHRSFYVDETTPEFEARLVLQGYERTDSLVMVLTSDLLGVTKPYETRFVESDADWQAYLAWSTFLSERSCHPKGSRQRRNRKTS